MYNSLQPHGLQHPRLPCLPLSPRVCLNSHPLSQWYHPTISSSVVPFSSCPQSFPASGSFPMSQLFTSGGQSIGVSASVLPTNIQASISRLTLVSWFPNMASVGGLTENTIWFMLCFTRSRKLSEDFYLWLWRGLGGKAGLFLKSPSSLNTGWHVVIRYLKNKSLRFRKGREAWMVGQRW